MKKNLLLIAAVLLLRFCATAQNSWWMNPYCFDEEINWISNYRTIMGPNSPEMELRCNGRVREMSVTRQSDLHPEFPSNQIFRFDSLGREILYIYRVDMVFDELFGANGTDINFGSLTDYYPDGSIKGICVFWYSEGEMGGHSAEIFLYKYDKATKVVHRDFYCADDEFIEDFKKLRIRSFQKALENISQRETPLHSEFHMKGIHSQDGRNWQRTVYRKDLNKTKQYDRNKKSLYVSEGISDTVVYKYQRGSKKSTFSISRNKSYFKSSIVDSIFYDEKCRNLKTVDTRDINKYNQSNADKRTTVEYDQQGRKGVIDFKSGKFRPTHNEYGDEICDPYNRTKYSYDYRKKDAHGNWLECIITIDGKMIDGSKTTETVRRTIKYW